MIFTVTDLYAVLRNWESIARFTAQLTGCKCSNKLLSRMLLRCLVDRSCESQYMIGIPQNAERTSEPQ